MELKIRVLDKCEHCGGKAYLPIGEAVDAMGNKFIRHRPCPQCEGSGLAGRWLELPKFLELLEQAKCPHEHISTSGDFHLSGGEVWDDIQEVCSDCGKVMR